jgi:hypothetical protein
MKHPDAATVALHTAQPPAYTFSLYAQQLETAVVMENSGSPVKFTLFVHEQQRKSAKPKQRQLCLVAPTPELSLQWTNAIKQVSTSSRLW